MTEPSLLAAPQAYYFHANFDRHPWTVRSSHVKNPIQAKFADDGSHLLLSHGPCSLSLYALPASFDPSTYLDAYEPTNVISVGSPIYDFVTDQGHVYYATKDHPIRVLNIASASCCSTFSSSQSIPIKNHMDEIESPISLALTEAMLLGGGLGKLFVVDRQGAGQETLYLDARLNGLVSSLSVAPSSPSILALGTFGHQIGVLDLRDDTPLQALVRPGTGHGISHLAYALDGWTIAASLRKSDAIELYDTRMLTGHPRTVLSRPGMTNQRLYLSMDGQYVYAGDVEGNLRAWNLASGAKMLCMKVADGPVPAIARHPYLPLLAVTDGGRRDRIADEEESASSIPFSQPERLQLLMLDGAWRPMGETITLDL